MILTLFNLFTKGASKNYQLTFYTDTFNSAMRHVMVLLAYLLVFSILVDWKYFINSMGGSLTDLISSVDIYLYYSVYIKFELDTIFNLYSNTYYAPVTNFSVVLVTSLLNYLELILFWVEGGGSDAISIFFGTYSSSDVLGTPFLFFLEIRSLFVLLITLLVFTVIFQLFSKFLYFYFLLIFFLIFIFSSFFSDFVETQTIFDYFEFQISESFKNRNLYVDSNYFLTSNTLFGLEKFSEVSVPWLVDYEDFGWGSDFDPQSQVLQIAERERKFITDEMNLNHSPHLENSNLKPGSLYSRLVKLKQRLLVYFSIFNRFFNEFYNIYRTFDNKHTYSVESDYSEWSRLVKNFFKKTNYNLFVTTGGFDKTTTSEFTSIKKNKEYVRSFLPKMEIKNDFVLPKKNNITNEHFKKAGSIVDRKQSVFRKLTDSLPSVDNNFKIKSRLPDLSKETNYVFERQLQYERSLELDFKEFVKKRIVDRFDFYYFTKNIPSLVMVRPLSYQPVEKAKPAVDYFLNTRKPNKEVFKLQEYVDTRYSSTDINLENLLKYWSNRNSHHNFIESRDLEFVYFKNTERFVDGFFFKESLVEDTLFELLRANMLGVGMFTYQDYGTLSGMDNEHAIFNVLDAAIKNNIPHGVRHWWKKKDTNHFYLRLRDFVELYFGGLNVYEKKCIMAGLSIFSIKIWFDFESGNVFPNINDIFRIALSEFLCTPPPFDDKVYSRVRNIKYYLFKDMYPSPYNKIKGRYFKNYKLLFNYKRSVVSLYEYGSKITPNSQTADRFEKKNKYFKNKVNNSSSYYYYDTLFLKYFFYSIKDFKPKNYFIKKITNESNFFFIKNPEDKVSYSWLNTKYSLFKFPNIPQPLPVKGAKWVGTAPASKPCEHAGKNSEELPNSLDFFMLNFARKVINFFIFNSTTYRVYQIPNTLVGYVFIDFITLLYYILAIFFSHVSFGITSVFVLFKTSHKPSTVGLETIVNFSFFEFLKKNYFLLTLQSKLHNVNRHFSPTTLPILAKYNKFVHSLTQSTQLLPTVDCVAFYIQLNCLYLQSGEIFSDSIFNYILGLCKKAICDSLWPDDGGFVKNSAISSKSIFHKYAYLYFFENIFIYLKKKKIEGGIFLYLNDTFSNYKKNFISSFFLYFTKINWLNLNLSFNFFFSYFFKIFNMLGVHLNTEQIFAPFVYTYNRVFLGGLKSYYCLFLSKYNYTFDSIFFKISNSLDFIKKNNAIIIANRIRFFFLSNLVYFDFNYKYFMYKFFFLLEHIESIFEIFLLTSDLVKRFWLYIVCMVNNELITLFLYCFSFFNQFFSYFLYLTGGIFFFNSEPLDVKWRLYNKKFNVLTVQTPTNILTAPAKSNQNYNILFRIWAVLSKKTTLSVWPENVYVAQSVYRQTGFGKVVKFLINDFHNRINQSVCFYRKSRFGNIYFFDNDYLGSCWFKKKSKLTSHLIDKNFVQNNSKINYSEISANLSNGSTFTLNLFSEELFFKKHFIFTNFKKLKIFKDQSKKHQQTQIDFRFFLFNCQSAELFANGYDLFFNNINLKKNYLDLRSNQTIINYNSSSYLNFTLKKHILGKNIFYSKDFVKLFKLLKFSFEKDKNNFFFIYFEKIVKIVSSAILTDFSSFFIDKYSFMQKDMFSGWFFTNNFNSMLTTEFFYYDHNTFSISDVKWGNLVNLKLVKDKFYYFFSEGLTTNSKNKMKNKVSLGMLNSYNHADFTPIRLKKNRFANTFSYFETAIKTPENINSESDYNSFIYKKKKLRKLFCTGENFSRFFFKNKKKNRYLSFSDFEHFNNREIDINTYFGSYTNYYFNYYFEKFNNLDRVVKYGHNAALSSFTKPTVEITTSNFSVDFLSPTTKNRLWFFNNFFIFYFSLFFSFKTDTHESTCWHFEFLNTFFEAIDIFVLKYFDFGVPTFPTFSVRKSIANKILIINFTYIIENIVNYLIWTKPIMLPYEFFKNFTELSDIYYFYLLERQGFSYKIFSELCEIYFVFIEKFFFDLIRIFIFFDLLKTDLVVTSHCLFYNILYFKCIFYYCINHYVALTVKVIDFSIYASWLKNPSHFAFSKTQLAVAQDHSSKLSFLFHNYFFLLKNNKISEDFAATDFDLVPLNKKLWYLTKVCLFELGDFVYLFYEYYLNSMFKVENSINLIFYIFFYLDINLDFVSMRALPILESVLVEWSQLYQLDNVSNIFQFFYIFEEFFDYLYIYLLFTADTLFEFYGQILWLDLCIFFDFLFERAVEFDFLTDVNPISDSIFIVIESFRSILSGNFLDNIPIFFFNFFDNDIHDDSDDEDFYQTSNNDDDFGDDTSYGLSSIEDMDSFEFLGWGSNVSIGTDPGNEFSTMNDILDFPVEVEKFFLTDISDFYNNIFGLDSPKIGSLSPTFDLTVPLNSLWVIEVLYYNPRFGGVLFINFDALFDFIKILYLDRRISFFSKIYDIVDFSVLNYRESWFVFFKLKINYFFIDLLQVLDSVYFNPFDFVAYLYFYFIYIFSYFGPWLPVFLYLFLIYISKFSKFFERSGRSFTFNQNAIVIYFSQSFTYFLFRYLYLFLSNSYLFLKMSVAILVFLTILYIFTEGLHFFSILRLYEHDQESLLYINSMFFNLERDPFVEKHIPNDEVWDQFKYDSFVDDDWSRTHYHRETTEILGGELENPTVLDSVGFARKHSFLHILDEQDSEFSSSVSQLTRAIPQQLHNRVPDESSYFPRFVSDTILEREFFRESEMYGPEVEGSLDWHSRSKNIIDTLEDNWRFTSWFTEQHIVESDNFAQWNWGFSRDNEDYYNDLYDALLLNIADPKWLYDSSNILNIYDTKPLAFNHSGAQMFDLNSFDLDRKKLRRISANSSLTTLLERNVGILQQSPILDQNDEDPLSDLSIDNYNMFGSSIGTISNSKSVFDDATADIITQKTKHSPESLVNMPVYFNFVENSEISEIDYDKSENFILENYFDSIYNTKPTNHPTKLYSTITEPFYNKFNRKRVYNYNSSDNFHKKMSKNWILENNFKVKKFVTDGIPEGYFNMTGYVFKDLNNYDKVVDLPVNMQDLSLENTRRRDLKFTKLEGSSPVTVHYDAMLTYNIDKLLYYNYDTIYGHFSNYSKYYNNNEYTIKFDLNDPNPYWTGRKFPRTRWKLHKRYGYKSPYQYFVEEDREDYGGGDIHEFAKDLGLDRTAGEFLTTNGDYYDVSIKKKKPYTKKIVSEFEKFLQPMKRQYLLKNKPVSYNKLDTLYVNYEHSAEETPKYFSDNALSNWVGSSPNLLPFIKKKKDISEGKRNLLTLLDTKFFKHANLHYLKFGNSLSTNKTSAKFSELGSWDALTSLGRADAAKFGGNLITIFRNSGFSQKKENFYDVNYERNNYKFFIKFLSYKPSIKIPDTDVDNASSEATDTKETAVLPKLEPEDLEGVGHSFSNRTLLPLDAKVKVFLKKKEIFAEGLQLKVKQPTTKTNMGSELVQLGSGYNLKSKELTVNDTYRKKIQEYLLSDYKDAVVLSGDAYDYDLDNKLNTRFFLNNSWSIDQSNRPIYDIPILKSNSDFLDNYSNLKDDSLLSFDSKADLLRPLWSSRRSRKFEDVSGFKNSGTFWPLSYRMHALILPKYSENPIFVSDEEANREYVESRNVNFSRRLNDLEVMGDGFIRELEYFREFNLNPLEYGRFYATPNWEEDEDKIGRDRGADMLQRKFNNWRHNRKESTLVGTTESSLDFEDLLLESGYAGNFKIAGGDTQKNLFIAGLGNKFYDVIDTDYFQKKVDWYKPSFFVKNKTKPWGFDYNTNLRWFGSQHWSIQKNLDSFSEMLSQPNYRVHDLELPDMDTYAREIVKFKSKKDIFTFLNRSQDTDWNRGFRDWDNVQPYLKNYNSWNFNNFEKIEGYNKFNNIDFDGESEGIISKAGINKGLTSSDVDIRMNKERSLYNILIMPENYFSTVDRDFNSELKHEWRTKFFQYGKMFKSLEQGVILQDFYSKFIPLSNRALTPRQISDYFWMLYKPYKKNKYNKFFKNYDILDRQDPTNHKVERLSWDLKVKNPNGPSSVELFGDNDGFNDKIDEFPNLGRNWLSVYLKKKMSQRRQNFTLSQLETYSSPELSFENININVPIKRSNLDVRKRLSQNNFNKNKNNVFTFDKTSWKKLLNIMERGDFSKVNKENWWFIAPKKTKNKTMHGARTSYVLDYLFGSHIKNKKYKNPLFDESNASHRYFAIENLKRKNINKPVKDNFYHKFKNPFAKSLNMLTALREVYEIPFDSKLNVLDDLQDSESYLDADSHQIYSHDSSRFSDLSEGGDYLFESDLSNSKKNINSFYSNIEYGQVQDSSFGDESQDTEDSFEQFEFEDNELSFESFKDLSSDFIYDSLQTGKFSDKVFYAEPDSDFDESDYFYENTGNLLPNQTNATSWVFGGILKNEESLDFSKFASYLDYGSLNNDTGPDENIPGTGIGSDSFSLDEESEDEDLELLLDEDDEVADSAPTFDYFYNKKYNTNLADGSNSNLSETPKIWTDSNSIFSGVSATFSGAAWGSFNRSGLDSNLLQPENQSTFYNNLLYWKNKNAVPIVKKRKLKPLNYGNRLNSKVSNSVGFNFLDKSSFLKNTGKVINTLGTELESINNDRLGISIGESRYSLKKKALYPNRVIYKKGDSGHSLDKIMAGNSHLSNQTEFSNNKGQIKDSLVATSMFFEKTNPQSKTGVSEINLDSNIGPFYAKHNHKKKGTVLATSPISDLVYLKKDTKVEPSFGSDRYKSLNTAAADTFSSDTVGVAEKDLFKFGISKSMRSLGKKNLTKSSLQHYFKYRDGLGSVNKSINNFFLSTDSEYKESDNSYISSVGIPVVKNLNEKFSVLSSKKSELNDNALDFSNTNSDFDESQYSYSSEISSIFKSTKQSVPLSNKKINESGFRLFSAGESIYPLPVLRSLSVDSKLFNKINSLRIFGASRLNDYFYKPKLKHLLKNQTNFYNFDTDFEVDDFGPEDDDFLYRFEDFDTYFTESSESANQQQSGQRVGDLMGLGESKNYSIFSQNKKKVDFGDSDWIDSSGAFYTTLENNDNIQGFVDDYEDSVDPIDIFESDEEEPEFLVEDDYDIELVNSEVYNAAQSVNLLSESLFLDQQLPDSYFIGPGFEDNQVEDYDYEFLEDLEDVDYLYSQDSSDRFFSSNIIDKSDWLLSTYKKLNKISANSKYSAWVALDKKDANFEFFENLDKSMESSRSDNNSWLLDSLSNIDVSSRSWDPTLPSSGGYATSLSQRLFEFNTTNVGNLDSAQDEFIMNFKSEDDFDDPFDSYSSELESLQEYLDDRFAGLAVPIERSDRPLWYDRSKFGWDNNQLDFTNLQSRKANLDKISKTFLKQNLETPYLFSSNYAVPSSALVRSEESEYVRRAGLVKTVNWNNESTPFTEVLDYYYGNGFNYFSDTENSDHKLIAKITDISEQQASLLRADLGDYFIKNQSELSLRSFNDFYNKKNIWNSPTVESLDAEFDIFNKDSLFQNIWNIYNDVDSDFTWKNTGGLKKIEQLGVSEKKNYLNTISDLHASQGSYIFKKNLLNLTKGFSKDSINNLSELIRKTNSNSNSQFGRRKYKKLKKKYWSRLDVVEKYINSIKNSVSSEYSGGKNLLAAEKSNLGKPITTATSVFNSSFLAENDFFGSEVDLDLGSNAYVGNYQILNSSALEVVNSTDFVKSFDSFFLNVDNTLKKTETKKNSFKNFDKFYNLSENFENLIEVDTIDTSDFLNAELPIDSANYLYYKFKNEDSQSFGSEVLKKDFFRLDDPVDFEEESEDSFSNYSKLRNTFSKLQIGKFSNSYIPVTAVSTFLSSLPKVSTHDYISESPKYVNFYMNKKNSSNSTDVNIPESPSYATNDYSFSKLNSIDFFNRPVIIDQFGIYHKDLQRPGLELRNRYSRLPIAPFRLFNDFATIADRSVKYGIGDYVFKNSPATRRTFDLATRKFGPDFRTNSTMAGYGQLEDITDFNLNSEEDSGLHNGLGYPSLREENRFVYDFFSGMEPKFGGSSIFTSKFLGFIWKNGISPSQKSEDLDQFSFTGENVPIFGHFAADANTEMANVESNEFTLGKSILTYGKVVSALLKKSSFSEVNYDFEPNFSRYVQTWNSSIPRKFKSRDGFLGTENESYYEDPMYEHLFSQSYSDEEMADDEDHSYAHGHWSNLPSSILSSLELSTGKIWESTTSENITGPIFEKDITARLANNLDEKNIGPLGYEEGDSLYDNRLLNRGWFPEKIAWSFASRSNSRVGSDQSTLEILSDYGHSFAHRIENFGISPDLEALKSLEWAGKSNKIFNAVDDILEGFGLEENIPFKPSRARQLFEWEDNLERPTYDFYDFDDFGFMEDDEEYIFSNWNDEEEFHRFKNDNFSTLPVINYLAETNAWADASYFGNVDSAYIAGTSLPLADSNLYDGLVGDFMHFQHEKFPQDPLNSVLQSTLPLPTNNLFSNSDFVDSELTEFSNYVLTEPMNELWNTSDGLENQKRNLESKYNMLETFKPKDSFNFSPNPAGSLKFDPEWVVNGEGWLGNTGSNIPIISNSNIPLAYLSPETTIYTQPAGVHSFSLKDDLDMFGGEDSPYFTLSDYQRSRIVRGRDNDVSNFPINSGWDLTTKLVPNSLNASWSHRLGGRSHVDFEEGNQDFMLDLQNWSEFSEVVGVLSGEGYQLSNSLEDNPDFIVFDQSAISQRNLWWKSVQGGHMTPQSRAELASALVNDRSEAYRDFLTSYDFKIFGKSWLNPQETKVPLKSHSFFGDVQINDFLSTFETDNFQNSDIFSEKTYGSLASSSKNWEQIPNYFSITLRPLLFKIYSFVIFYIFNWYSVLNGKIFIYFYFIASYIYFKLDFLLSILKIYSIYSLDFSYWVYFYPIKLLCSIFKLVVSTLNFVLLFIVKLQSFLTVSNFDGFFDFYILFTIKNYFLINFKFGTVFFYKKLLLNLVLFIFYYVLFMFLLIFF